MKQHLYTKLLILYFMLGGICFLLLSSGGSYLVEKRLERSTGESLYRTASQLVSKNELRQAVKNPKNESLTLALSSAAAFQNADFWVMDTAGNVLINTNQHSSDSGDITVRNFRPEDYEDTCYSSGTFYGTLKNTQLSTVVPIKDADQVIGYLVIHYPMKNLYESRSSIVEVMVLIFIVIYALFFSFLLIYFYRVHKPLKEILKGALEFANGNLSYTIPVDSEDEMGYLSHSLNYMADKLNKNGEYQRQFISNVSHDFRSPLTSIKGYVEAMLDGTIPPEMQERYLKVIAFESTRLEKLTRSLLTLNELDVKKRMMHLRRFDINETIRTTAATFEGTCSERNIRLELLLAGKELFVRADMEQIQQVLYNLLDNAVKFSSDNSSITLETTVNHGKVFVSVKDHGTGIPKESLSRIWDRFYKIDASRGKDRKGTGLGLAIVKEIINAHKQNINVISTVGVGTEFIFTLEKAK